jgi:thioredoxin-dependent peroxiredoxin
MLKAGDPAPDFTAPSAAGPLVQLSSLRGRPVVLYFFPKANSLGCTVETRAFADHFAEFQRAGVEIVGISVDPVGAQKTFATKCDVAFPLLSDGDKSIARAYGVLGFLGFARRVTFFIGSDGVIEEVVEAIGPTPHVRRGLERIAGTPAPSAPSPGAPPTRG